jgi:hypothetical protein
MLQHCGKLFKIFEQMQKFAGYGSVDFFFTMPDLHGNSYDCAQGT